MTGFKIGVIIIINGAISIGALSKINKNGLATLFRTIFQRSACLNSTGLLYPKLP